MFLMWLGEQITARGIGNGISLIIWRASSRSCRRPSPAHARTRPSGRAVDRPDPAGDRDGDRRHRLHRLHGARAATSADPVPKRQVGDKMFEGQSSHLP
ncbi:MAG: hypothetical protein R3D69_17055 [Xanthobacteraceae bacterium]